MALKARISLFSLTLLGIILFGGCKTEENSELPAEELEEVALQIISDGTFQYSEKGDVKNVLEAGRLERWESDGESREVWRVSEGFTLFIEGDKHQSEAFLRGGRGIYDADKGHLIAYDDIELVNNENERLRTEYLVWILSSYI